MGRKTHINKIPPKLPGQSRQNFVYVCFSLCVFFAAESLSHSEIDMGQHQVWPGEGSTIQWKWSPPSPGSLKALLFPRLVNKVQNEGTRGVPFISIVQCPSHPVILGVDERVSTPKSAFRDVVASQSGSHHVMYSTCSRTTRKKETMRQGWAEWKAYLLLDLMTASTWAQQTRVYTLPSWPKLLENNCLEDFLL